MSSRCQGCGTPGRGSGRCGTCNWAQAQVDIMESYKEPVGDLNGAITAALGNAISSGWKKLTSKPSPAPAPASPAATRPSTTISLDITATAPPEINTAVLRLYVAVYNSGDKTLLRKFVDKYYVEGYTSQVNGKPYSSSREDVFPAISSAMDKKWTLTNVQIVEATADHVKYTYTLAYVGGTAPCGGYAVFNPVGKIASTSFTS
jgi:hypothetical protein